MLNGFQKLEKRILAIAAVCFVLFSYFLYDDSLFDFDSNTNDLIKIGVISKKSNDVRQKYSKRYLWKKTNANSDLHQGDSIFTGAKSESQIELLDGSKMIVHENSLVVFSVIDGQVGLDFNFGGLIGGISGKTKLRLTDCGQVYELSGGGSEFQIDKEGGCTGMKVKVISGQVSVNGSTLKKSQTAIIKNTKKGSPPRIIPIEQVAPPPVKPIIAEAPKPEPTPEPEKIVAPIIVEPQENFQHLLAYDDLGKLTTAPYFPIKWTHPKNQTNFEFEIAGDQKFRQVVSKLYAKGLSTKSPELKSGTYYLRVREYISKQQSPDLYVWSNPVAFSVQETRMEPKLQAPVLLTKTIDYRAPAPELPIFKWTSVPSAAQYILELSTNSKFNSSINTSLDKLSFVWSDFREGKYYFRVTAVSNLGARGFSSETGSIKVNLDRPILNPVPPKVVRAKDPEDPGDPQPFEVKWSGLPIAGSYQVELSEDDKFQKPLIITSREPAGVITVPKPGSYKWRVRPLASTGTPLTPYSDSGDIRYDLKVPLITPKLLEPAENITLFFQNDSSPIFWMEWKPVRQAEIYDVEVSTKKDFSVIQIRTQAKAARFLVREKLPQGKLYWRVRANGDGKSSDWSEVRRMSIFAGKSAMIHSRESDD